MKNALTVKNIILVLSLVLNALGGTGTISPVVGGPSTPPVIAPCAE